MPDGSQARVHAYSVHRDPRNFSHPDTFWPDRWLIAEGLQKSDEKIIHNANAFIPFSIGPWQCVGKGLAVQEMRTVLCHSVQQLRFSFAPGWDPEEWDRQLQDKFAIKTGSMSVVVQRR